MYAPVLVTPPSASDPLITYAEAQLHLRVEGDDEKTLIETLIAAATAHLDGWSGILGRCLVTQTWRQTYDGFCREMRLPLPAATIASIISTNAAGTPQAAIGASNYLLLHNALGSFVRFKDAYSFATDLAEAGGVAIDFTAGYGAAAVVPAAIKQAALLLVGHWYMTRGAVNVGNITELPLGVKALLAPYIRTGV